MFSRRFSFILIVFSLLTLADWDLHSQDLSSVQTSTRLINRSLDLDISTAKSEELAAWCLFLGLPDDGSDDQLRGSLRQYYGLTQSDSTRSPGGSETKIVIESAQRSEYFKVNITNQESETLLRFSGEVLMSVSEADIDRTHRVEADTVVFNQQRNTITATGNVSYVVDTNGRIERFSGDSITFELSDWTGVIFRGTSVREQIRDGKNVSFFFRGDSIHRAESQVLILEEGSITSHNVENPDYALRTKKIWITGPDEWGLLRAVLYVGHIPMFYLPFYWKSGDDLLFNPVVGFRSRVGYFIQTTTYFMGQKEAENDFSIMGIGDTTGTQRELIRDGLFMVKGPRIDVDSADAANSLKYILDVYTSLGAMSGFVGNFPHIGGSASLDFYSSIGVSRSIDSFGSIFFDEDGSAQTYWNDSYLGPVTLPFRWGFRLNSTWREWSIGTSWYSDPFYNQDFGNRKENFEWLTFLVGQEGTDVRDPDLVNDLSWEISGSETVAVSKTSPWLNQISLDHFKTSLNWRNRINEDIQGSNSPDALYDPARYFYYPDLLVLPDLKVTLSGAAPSWSQKRMKTPHHSAEQDIPEEVESRETDKASTVAFRPSIDPEVDLFDASLNYTLHGQLYIEDNTNSSRWETPSDIDFQFDSAKTNTTEQLDVAYDVGLWNKMTGLTGTTNLSNYYQVHSNLFGSDVKIADTVQLDDYRYNKFLWDNRLTVYFKPFQGTPSLSETSVSYSNDVNLFSREFSQQGTVNSPRYTNTWVSSKEDFRQNEVSATTSWKPGIFAFSLVTSADIPPLEERYSILERAAAAYKGFGIEFSQQNSFTNDTWSVQPLLMSASWKGWKDEVSIRQSAMYDVEETRFSSARLLFQFWGFETRFIARYGKTYKWDRRQYEWEEVSEGFVPDTLQYSYRRVFDLPPFWKYRIKAKTILDISWDISLKQFTNNVLEFRWSQEFHIHKFLDLKLSLASANQSMYLYFPWWREELGISRNYNFFVDLLRSFNIFDAQERVNSHFNMSQVELNLVHHLRDWDLTVEYSGWPVLETQASLYKWKSTLSLYVSWNPIPVFNQRTQQKDEKWSVDSFNR